MKNRNLLVISVILIFGSIIGFVTKTSIPNSIWVTLAFTGSCLLFYACIEKGMALKSLLICTSLIVAAFLVSNFFLSHSASLVYFANIVVGSLLVYSTEKNYSKHI